MILLTNCSVFFGQNVPQGINYQGVANDASGFTLVNQTIGIKISLYAGSASGILEWEETHTVTTNQFGLFTVIIGQGTNTTAGSIPSFSLIDWGAASHYLKVSMDITGGSSYTDMDNSQLLSVPYALYSARSGGVQGPVTLNDLSDVDTSGASVGKVLRWNGSLWMPAIENDSVAYAVSSGSSVYSDSAATALNSVSSTYSDTASYALNCANITNDWHLAGNTGIIASNFIGTTNAENFIIKTNNLERLRITTLGKVGIGTISPSASLHLVGNDGFISQGTFGSGIIPATGTGTRLMWYPKKAAFRVGYVASTQWDDINIGNYSFASGISSQAKGIGAVAMGQLCSAGDSCGVAMGFQTNASGKYAVAMGNVTIASGNCAVALGRGGIASGIAAQAIGYHVTASGNYSTAFGNYCVASGANSVAMGFTANTNNMSGSFVFADNSDLAATTYATAPNQFMVKASGGTIFYSNSTLTSGVSLAAGGGAWLTVSDKNKKEHFKKMDGEVVLKEISKMEISSWNYKTQKADIRHLGPMAQDFYKAFKLGESDTTITTTDIDGINMLAIQALSRRTAELNEKAKEVAQLKKQVDELLQQKYLLEKRLLLIEDKMNINNTASIKTSK